MLLQSRFLGDFVTGSQLLDSDGLVAEDDCVSVTKVSGLTVDDVEKGQAKTIGGDTTGSFSRLTVDKVEEGPTKTIRGDTTGWFSGLTVDNVEEGPTKFIGGDTTGWFSGLTVDDVE